MFVNAEMTCPYCDWSGLWVDEDSGTLFVDKPCRHLLYVYGFVPYGVAWKHPALSDLIPRHEEPENLESLRRLKNDYPKRTPEGGKLRRYIRAVERKYRAERDEVENVDEEAVDDVVFDWMRSGGRRRGPFRPSVETFDGDGIFENTDWSLHVLFSVDPEAFVREVVEYCRK